MERRFRPGDDVEVRRPDYGSRIGALMQFSVVEGASGRELPIYSHLGEYWVAGTPGTRYAIRARNGSGARVMAVMSVDGINVISGETAGYGQTGYVFGPGEVGDIAGWRKSDAQVAAFEFTSLGDSYASPREPGRGRSDPAAAGALAASRGACGLSRIERGLRARPAA